MRSLAQRLIFLILAAAMCTPALRTQTAPSAEQGALVPTLQVQSRLVVEDVLVMDAHGNPVHGLPASSFHVFDNGKPQRLRDFEEGSPKLAEQAIGAPLPVGVFSNAAATAPASTTEVLLIDTDDIGLTDQMFLGEQLRQSLAAMPENLPVSIFSVSNGRVVPVIAATTDRAALARSVADMLPVQNHAIDSKFQSALNQLMTVAALLQQTQGRKNLIWFAGEFPLVSVSSGEQVAGGVQVNYTERENDIHQVQEALAEARISVYPVDVRGVITVGMAVATADTSGLTPGASTSRNPRLVNQASQKREVEAPGPASVADQRSEMQDLAAVTGGRAYMLNNLAEEIDQAFALGKSAYTLAYTPSPYSTDQSLHTVAVQVDGGYTVSYRRNYLATFTGDTNDSPRLRLTTQGVQKVASRQNKPLVFQVRLVPGADEQHVRLDFSIAMSQLEMLHLHGEWSNTLLVDTYAYDSSGKVRDGKAQELETHLNDARYQQARDADKRVMCRQDLHVPKSAKYLMVVVRDKASERTGSLLLQTRLLASLPPQAPEPAASPAASRATP